MLETSRAEIIGEAGFTEPIGVDGLEVQGRHIVETQHCRPDIGMRGTRFRQFLPPYGVGVDRYPSFERHVRHRAESSFGDHTQGVELAVGSMIRPITRSSHTLSELGIEANSSSAYTAVNASSRTAIRKLVIGSGAGPSAVTNPKSSYCWPPASRSVAAAFNAATSAAVCAEPRSSISRDPRRLDPTIWTAVAPDLVFTVRTNATRAA